MDGTANHENIKKSLEERIKSIGCEMRNWEVMYKRFESIEKEKDEELRQDIGRIIDCAIDCLMEAKIEKGKGFGGYEAKETWEKITNAIRDGEKRKDNKEVFNRVKNSLKKEKFDCGCDYDFALLNAIFPEEDHLLTAYFYI